MSNTDTKTIIADARRLLSDVDAGSTSVRLHVAQLIDAFDALECNDLDSEVLGESAMNGVLHCGGVLTELAHVAIDLQIGLGARLNADQHINQAAARIIELTER